MLECVQPVTGAATAKIHVVTTTAFATSLVACKFLFPETEAGAAPRQLIRSLKLSTGLAARRPHVGLGPVQGRRRA